jgi:hypothetical protein
VLFALVQFLPPNMELELEKVFFFPTIVLNNAHFRLSQRL